MIKKRKKKKSLPMFPVAVFVIGFLVLWWVYGLVGSGETTYIAVSGTIEDMISADGVFVRHETVMTSDAIGVIQGSVKEGERVAKGQHIGVLLKGNIDPSLQNRLESVNSRIAEVKANIKNPVAESDINAIDDKLSSISAEIITYSKLGDQYSINRVRKDIDRLIEKKSLITGQSGPAAGVIDRLLGEKQQIEAQMGQNKTDIYAPTSGIFTTGFDGFENMLNPDKIGEITTSNIDTVLKAKKTVPQKTAPFPICRIVDNTEWVVAINASSNDVQGLNVGDFVFLRFPNDPSVEIEAWVASISAAQNGRAALCVKSSQFTQGVFSQRATGVEVIKHRYRGLKIPNDAITNQNGKDGAFVQKATGLQFREAEIIYKGKDFTIVKENNKNLNSILLYDEVVAKKR